MAKTIVKRCHIRDRRRSLDLTQSELAAMIGVAKERVSEYERLEVIPSLPTAASLAIALRCTIDDLYEWEARP